MNQHVPLISPFLRLKFRAMAFLGSLVLAGVLLVLLVAVMAERLGSWLVK